MSDYLSRPQTRIAPESEPIFQSLRGARLAVLCGRNNSGKSFVLRRLVREQDETAYYLGPSRYHNFSIFQAYGPIADRKRHTHQLQVNHFNDASSNQDNNPIDLPQAISQLTDRDRDALLHLLELLLHSKTEIKDTIPYNSMSQKYVSVDGFNLSFTSTGFRLVAMLLTALLNRDHSKFLIDEPELGLSPEIQGIVADFLFEKTNRDQYFPHIESLVFATHSSVFLDRKAFGNNYVVERSGPDIGLRRLSSVQELNSLQFYLLGNRFENLFLPGAIFLVEGICDFAYVSKVVATRFPNSLVSVVQCNGDGRIRDMVDVARQMLFGIQRSPYSNRLFVMLDKAHGTGLPQQLEQMGVSKGNIIVWDSNGIEYLYPHSVLAKRFGEFSALSIHDDLVSANGVPVKKKDLSAFVVENVTAADILPQEFVEKVLEPLSKVLY